MAANTDPWQGPGKSRRKACGECRRLKLRCTGVFPCESCQKRGCAAICPRGSFLKGTRSLKTSALKLHEKMSHVSARIQELEHALAELQASVSAEPHPLLMQVAEEHERSHSPNSIPAGADTNVSVDETSDELSVALGALTIRPYDEAQFHGETASSEFLLQTNAEARVLPTATGWDPNASARMPIPADLVLLSVLFPFSPSMPGEPVSRERILPFLPPYLEALRLSDIYYTHVSWCAMPISREELHETILMEVYGHGTPVTVHQVSLHRLSLLLMIFALGALFDVDKLLCPAEAEEYHSLARAALCEEQIFNNITLDCIQSMTLMIWYMRLCPRRSKGYLWAFSGLLSKVVQAFGLHREVKNLTSQETLRRQTTFWEYISGDVWQSFAYGRPSSMVFSQIDCKKPRELSGVTDKTTVLFYKWKHSFTHLVGDVLSQATGATTTNYKTLFELERKIREYPLQAPLRLPDFHSSMQNDAPLSLTLQRYIIRSWQHATLMALHRRFLVQAIRIHPNDVTQSPFVKSVYAAYESACVLIMDLGSLYETYQRVVCRMQPFWSHAFSAAIVLGALVLCSPSCIVADRAMFRLGQAYDLFVDAAAMSVQAPDALDSITNLRSKAQAAFMQYQATLGAAPGLEHIYTSLGSSSTNSETNKGSSPTPSQTVESPVQFMHARPPSPGLYQQPPVQGHANYAAPWLQQQAYFGAGPSDVGVGIGANVIAEGTQMPYELLTACGVEDDAYAADWLHRKANDRGGPNSEGRNMEMPPHYS